jgi:hypothetical protein
MTEGQRKRVLLFVWRGGLGVCRLQSEVHKEADGGSPQIENGFRSPPEGRGGCVF